MRNHGSVCGFYEKADDRVNSETIWKVLRMYDGGKLLNGIKSVYVNSLACVRVKRGERECDDADEENRCGRGLKDIKKENSKSL